MAEHNDEKPLRRSELLKYQERLKNGDGLSEDEIKRVRARQALEDHRRWLWGNIVWFFNSITRVVVAAAAFLALIAAISDYL